MFKLLFQLSWKEFWRSFSLAKNVLTSIMWAFVALYFAAILISFGIFFPLIAEKIAPVSPAIDVVNHGLIYFFLLDILIRVLVLGSGKFDIEKLLHLPIRKFQLIQFFFFRSLFKVNNFLPILFGIPFLFSYLGPANGWLYGFSWLSMVFLFTLSLHFLSLYLSKQQFKRPILVLIGLGLIALLIWLDWYSGFELMQPVVITLNWLAATGIGLLAGLVLLVMTLVLCYRFLFKNMYLTNDQGKGKSIGNSFQISWFSRFGAVGQLVNMDFQMIFRNKRPRTNVLGLLFMIPLFMFQINIGEDATFSNAWGALLIFIFLTGLLQININQYFYAWDGSYFDLMLTGKIRTRDYLTSKFVTSFILTTISVFILSPFFWWYPLLFPYFLVGLIYNIGFLPFIYLYLSTYNRTAIDLNKSAWFNYEGNGVIQYLIVIPVMGPALLFYLPFFFLGYETIGLLMVAILGMTGLVFFKPLMKLTEKQFLKQKYKLAAAFRKKR